MSNERDTTYSSLLGMFIVDHNADLLELLDSA